MKLEGVIYCGDNLEWMRQFPDEFVDLCYIDPPFFSNRKYEIIFHDGEEIRAFEDRWKGGIEHYVAWMRDRVFEIHRLLKATGSFYLHCDYHASHYLKVMCDGIFGIENFRNEVVWHYGGWRRKMKGHFSRKHDILLFYAKSDESTFNSYSLPWSREEYVRVRKQKVRKDKEGREYVLSDAGDGKRTKRYIEDALKQGRPVDSVWEIDALTSSDKTEAMGYPTQKPEALLERIIVACSNAGDLVFDPFCGCGTTLVVAQRLKRRWLGIDVSPTACKLMQRRLAKEGVTRVQTPGIRYESAELKKLKPFEFQNWVVGIMSGTVSDKKSADMGIDGYSFMERDPIQVKQQESIGRPDIDKFETAIRRVGKQKGYVVAFGFTKGAYDEVARVKRKNDLEIELLTVKELVEKYGK